MDADRPLQKQAEKDPDVFAHQFDEQGRMRILDGMRYYKKTEAENNMPRMTIVMDKPVDRECLQYAAEMALGRLRVHSLTVVSDEARFYLRQNARKPVVHCDDGTQHLVCTEENSGYMTWIGYRGRSIIVEIFHGVTDGIGTVSFSKTLLYYYCKRKYGGIDPASVPGLILADTPEDPQEYADSMLFLPDGEAAAGKRYAYERAFQIPGGQIAAENACKYYELKIDAGPFDDYVRQNASSRAAVFGTLMNQAIASFHDIGGTPVVMAMAVDARRAYGAQPTMQCCVATVPLWLDQEIQALPIPERLRRAKQMVKDGLQPESILASALRTKKFNEMMEEKFPSLAEKKAFCRKVAEEGSDRYTYGLSYVGEIRLGPDIEKHVEDYRISLCANTIPIILEITQYKGRYRVSYCTHLEDDRYVHRFREMFLSAGIPCTCEQGEDYIEARADF